MKVNPNLSAMAIRALAWELADRLNGAPADILRTQPGRLLFPKRTHELGPTDGDAPDGLGANYMELAARLNRCEKLSGTPDLLAVLLRTVEAEITRARLVEARLIEAMEQAE
jgi:hypothetical protein